MIKMQKLPLSKTRYDNLKKVCKENKVKCPAYSKFITTKLKELLERFGV